MRGNDSRLKNGGRGLRAVECTSRYNTCDHLMYTIVDYYITLVLGLEQYRRDFTVFSGLSHVGYPGGHHTEVALLTGVAPEGVRFGDIRNTISLDQEVAARLGGATRFAYLALGGGPLSWNRKGV